MKDDIQSNKPISIVKNDKQRLAERAITRAICGLCFLEDYLRNRRGGTDAAYSRSWYILLSFNFELILNALLILESKEQKGPNIIRDIMGVKPMHDFEKLSKRISTQMLSNTGIKSIKKRQSGGFTEYVVKMTSRKNVIIQDLVDVRYDFKKDNLRKSDPNEISKIKKEIETLHKVAKSIQKLI